MLIVLVVGIEKIEKEMLGTDKIVSKSEMTFRNPTAKNK
jgi:hypothetical protein